MLMSARWGAFLLACGVAAGVWAKPDPQQAMEAAVLHQPSAYRFTTLTLGSVDGLRHYRVWIGQPQAAPATSVAYLLDGNAALMALDTAFLDHLARNPAPPALVAVGYATPLRIDRTARTFDYTPPITSNGPQADPLTNLPAGGADAFLALLTDTLQPLVNQRLGQPLGRRMLWGHSYGGLFVLHALAQRPATFDTYAAASPSLWWGHGALLTRMSAQAPVLAGHSARLLLMRGTEEPALPSKLAADAGPADDGADNEALIRQLMTSLQPVQGLTTEYRRFPGLGHGPMLEASLRDALDDFSR